MAAVVDALAIFIGVISWAAALAVLGWTLTLPRKRQLRGGLIGLALLSLPGVLLAWRMGDARLGLALLVVDAALAVAGVLFEPLNAWANGFARPASIARQAEIERRWSARRSAGPDRSGP